MITILTLITRIISHNNEHHSSLYSVIKQSTLIPILQDYLRNDWLIDIGESQSRLYFLRKFSCHPSDHPLPFPSFSFPAFPSFPCSLSSSPFLILLSLPSPYPSLPSPYPPLSSFSLSFSPFSLSSSPFSLSLSFSPFLTLFSLLLILLSLPYSKKLIFLCYPVLNTFSLLGKPGLLAAVSVKRNPSDSECLYDGIQKLNKQNEYFLKHSGNNLSNQRGDAATRLLGLCLEIQNTFSLLYCWFFPPPPPSLFILTNRVISESGQLEEK